MIKNNTPSVIIISGPTGTGKSDFVLKLGSFLGNSIEIINADIGSLYTPLTIGTAKPDWQSSPIQHHFFDTFDKPEHWTAPQFRESLQQLIPEIIQRGNAPVIVGGSAFYIQSFFYQHHALENPDQELVARLEAQSSDQLWQSLHAIDPERAEAIDMNDQYRLVRALAIWYTQHQKPSEFQPDYNPIAPFEFVVLTRDRDQLYGMINQRVTSMMQLGWLDEVRSLLDNQDWVDFLCKKKMIGYDVLIGYLSGHYQEQDYNEVVDLIAQRTRNYAKRQLTFLKRLIEHVTKDEEKLMGEDRQASSVKIYNLTTLTTQEIVQDMIQNMMHAGPKV